MYLLGFDIGSSSVKAALVEASSGATIQIVQHPETEMEIISNKAGWAEQHPEDWWQNVSIATGKLLERSGIDPKQILSIGIAYQMHGLVCVDKDQKVLRPSIIWCDGRAIETGNNAFEELGKNYCIKHLLNSPGNFTASKLKWVRDNEPEVFKRIDKIMLPGDYIAMKLTGSINTTISGLSEGVFWDFEDHKISDALLEHFGIRKDMIPVVVDTFTVQGLLNKKTADKLGLKAGIPVGYRAGDQPNNALSLGVLEPNEVAATGGTSGVIYGVVNQLAADKESRVNSFAHVNHTEVNNRIGLLLCINGAGIQYAWIKKYITPAGISYEDMEHILSSVPVGSDGLRILPFGNGAERMFNNMDIGSHIMGLQFNKHTQSHIYRAALEGIAYSFVYGFQLLKGLGMETDVIKVGNDNLFQSKVFSTTIANLINTPVEVYQTTGAVGAAKASGFGSGVFNSLKDALKSNTLIKTFEPNSNTEKYIDAYKVWERDLIHTINKI